MNHSTKATFTLTRADFSRLQAMVGQRLKRQVGFLSGLSLFRVLVWFSVGFAGAAYARVLRENPDISDSLLFVALLLVLAALCLVAAPFVQHAMLRRHMLSPDGAFLLPQTVEFTEHALLMEGGAGKAEVPWSRILACEQDEANYYLFVDALQAVVLPRSAVAGFASELERRCESGVA